ncbi:hypothetical protein PISMIDRAFT_80236, partial [Pisolithus microcarpus 441]
DLDAIIMLGQITLEFIPPENPQRCSALIDLAGLLSERFNNEGRKEDLEELISLTSALERIPPPDRCRPLLNLANALHEQFQTQGTRNSVIEAISLARAAWSLCTPGH